MMRVLPMLLLVGCPWIGPELHDNNSANDDTDDGEGIEFVIDGIEPTFSPTSTTTQVRILGAGFEPDESDAYEVFFGSQRAVITDVQTDVITVEAPSIALPGVYTIELVDDDDATSLADAYTTYTNRSNANINGDSGTGAIGTLSAYTFWDADWPRREPDYGEVGFALTTGEQVVDPRTRFGPGVNQCTTVRPRPPVTTIALPDSTVRITSDTTTIDIPPADSGNGYLLDGSILPSELNGSFALEPVGATPLNPVVGIDPLFEMPPPLQILSPTFGEDRVSQNSVILQWVASDGEPGDFIAVEVEVWNADWSAILQTLYCSAEDDGDFRVTPAAFSDWQSGQNLHVRVGRARNLPTVLPHNRSASAAVAVNWIVGPLTTVSQ